MAAPKNVSGFMAPFVTSLAIGVAPFAAMAASGSVLYSFAEHDYPNGELTVINGVIYGTTYRGGDHGAGSVYSLTRAGVYTTLYSFKNDGPYGDTPEPGIAKAGKALIGATGRGGADSEGVAFLLARNGQVKDLHDFGASDSPPNAALIDLAGVYYGTGIGYDVNNFQNPGSAFALDRDGSEAVLYTFPSGVQPARGRLVALNGTLYGATGLGGDSNNGTVYSLTPQGAYQQLYSFLGGTDGSAPDSGLIEYRGELYGETYIGGANNQGVVYKLSPGGVETVLHSFKGKEEGANPDHGLLRMGHTFYGVNDIKGPHKLGTVFSMTLQGNTTLLYGFGAFKGVGRPSSGLVNIGKVLYGVASKGGANEGGGVYAITP